MTPEQIEQERQAFEAWYGAPHGLNRAREGHYVYAAAHNAWTVWLARAERSRERESALFEALQTIAGFSTSLRHGGPALQDLQELNDALEAAVDIADRAIEENPQASLIHPDTVRLDWLENQTSNNSENAVIYDGYSFVILENGMLGNNAFQSIRDAIDFAISEANADA